MNELIKRAAPGLALAGVALSTVWLFDPALHRGDTEEASSTATGSGQSADTEDDDAETGDEDSTTQEAAPDSGAADEGSGGTSQSTPASSDCSTAESATGRAVMTEWGPVQVQVEFAPDGSVCSVQAVAYPDNDPKSARINARAIPYLDQQASQVGTAFDSVSGATYTSEAYRESLQSILDQR